MRVHTHTHTHTHTPGSSTAAQSRPHGTGCPAQRTLQLLHEPLHPHTTLAQVSEQGSKRKTPLPHQHHDHALLHQLLVRSGLQAAAAAAAGDDDGDGDGTGGGGGGGDGDGVGSDAVSGHAVVSGKHCY